MILLTLRRVSWDRYVRERKATMAEQARLDENRQRRFATSLKQQTDMLNPEP
ncbi:MAG TPA: hypothetical protein VFW73_12110 [Lacipirellulaceae bacterium]|nr:hypothetical protein [Lacipirellulaceae bacterium]